MHSPEGVDNLCKSINEASQPCSGGNRQCLGDVNIQKYLYTEMMSSPYYYLLYVVGKNVDKCTKH